MSRLPEIRRSDLSEKGADQARVERIWKRVREDLPAPLPSAPAKVPYRARGGRATLLLAATFGVFAAGIVIGRSGSQPPPTAGVEQDKSESSAMVDVFAAGTRGRSFSLPGGGRVHLDPDSMVEVVAVSDARVQLSLLRGGATFEPSSLPIEVVAGEARISAPAGSSVSLARRESDLDVLVPSGSSSVDVRWPEGHDVVTAGHTLPHVPIVATLSANEVRPRQFERVEPSPDPVTQRDRIAPSRSPDASPRTPQDSTGPNGGPALTAVEQTPTWMALYSSNKLPEALSALDKAGGLESNIGSAQSVRELWALWELAQEGQKSDLAVRALRRLADDFGSDPSVAVAALQLADYYEASDKQLAAKYRNKAAQAKALAEVALCGEVRSAMGENVSAEEAIQTASKYLKDFPKGTCASDAQSLLEDARTRLGKEKPGEKEKSEPGKNEPAGAPKAEPKEPEKAEEKKKDPSPAPSASASSSGSAKAAPPPKP